MAEFKDPGLHHHHHHLLLQVLELSGELRQEWDDFNLRFPGTRAAVIDSIGLSGTSGQEIKGKVWRPDITASNEVQLKERNPHGDDFLRISSEGHLSWTQRVHYSFPCPLDLSGYPLGVHTCKLKLNSLGYFWNELQPSWHGEGAMDHSNVMMSHGYELSVVKTSAETVTLAHKPRRQLLVEMEIKSFSGWTVKHTVIPMIATVTTAYLAFFINIRGACARLITCLMSLMTAAIFHENTYRRVPQAGYTMAIEVFTGTCLTFIFVATVETVVVDVLSHLPGKGRRSTPSPHTSFALEVGDQKPDLTDERVGARGHVAAIWLDRCFRVLYPAAFLAFNGVYWVLYN
ncbi:glycine receptor subunit alpha-3-like [Panulirus ornatus]|uniref:glycine receptor subunit alpha-3-like n=1 Tax=Panulirus ornatus TaxID=150431 RepID=UPI003A86644B